jgi:hypothetical protein
MKKVIIALALLSCPWLTFGQGGDAKRVLLVAIQKLKQAAKADVNATVLTKYQEVKTIATKQGMKQPLTTNWETKVKARRSNYVSQTLSVYSDPEISIVLYHSKKTIIVQRKPQKEPLHNYSNLLGQSLDRYVKDIENVSVKAKVDTIVGIKTSETQYWLSNTANKASSIPQMGFIVGPDTVIKGYVLQERVNGQTTKKEIRILRRYRTVWPLKAKAISEVFDARGNLRKQFSSYSIQVVN